MLTRTRPGSKELLLLLTLVFAISLAGCSTTSEKKAEAPPAYVPEVLPIPRGADGIRTHARATRQSNHSRKSSPGPSALLRQAAQLRREPIVLLVPPQRAWPYRRITDRCRAPGTSS